MAGVTHNPADIAVVSLNPGARCGAAQYLGWYRIDGVNVAKDVYIGDSCNVARIVPEPEVIYFQHTNLDGVTLHCCATELREHHRDEEGRRYWIMAVSFDRKPYTVRVRTYAHGQTGILYAAEAAAHWARTYVNPLGAPNRLQVLVNPDTLKVVRFPS